MYSPPSSLPLSSTRRILRLIRLLRTLRRSPLLLRLSSRLRSRRSTGLRTLGSALLDYIEGGADDGTLGFHLAAAAGFGLFLRGVLDVCSVENGVSDAVGFCGWMLYLRDTLPPCSPAEDRPGDAAGVLALEEERFGFAVLEAEDFAVAADEELALVCVSLHSNILQSLYCVCVFMPLLL